MKNMKKWIALILCLLLSGAVLAQDDLTPYEIALERILEAEVTGTISLDLSNLGLRQLPPEIGNLTNLQYLYLFNNQLSSLPPEITGLTNLQYLWLDDNALTNLPPEIGNLNNLHLLYLSNNQLSSLPPEFGNLSNLQELSLYNNQLSSLPPEFGNLSRLCVSDIRDNQLRHLPTALAQLETLRIGTCGLYVEGNPLISPPEEILAGGTPAILDYLRNQAWWHLQRLLISVASGVGLLAALFLGLRYRQRRNRKPKQKREVLS